MVLGARFEISILELLTLAPIKAVIVFSSLK
jgi:hypothetical protein